jgi:flagellar hook assembly protein FlgD
LEFNPAKSKNASQMKARTDVREATPDGGIRITHQTGKNVISKDGKTLTQTFKGTDSDGKPVHGTNLYDKQ